MSAIFTIECLVIIIIIFIAVYQKFKHKDCVTNKRLDGKTALVTGGTAGMGVVIARELARRGARVIIACPFPEEGNTARERIVRATHNRDVHFQLLDLASFASTRRFASEILAQEPRLDLLVNNAGVGGPLDRKTADGINFVMQVNYFGTFLLTLLLLPLLKKSGQPGEPSRIVNIASFLHFFGKIKIDSLHENYYRFFQTEIYANSKLCLVFFTRELAKRLIGTNVVVNSLEPGLVGTRIFDNWNSHVGFLFTWVIKRLFKTSREGAQTTLHVALDDAAGAVSGEHFMECCVSKASQTVYDEDLSIKVWNESMKIINLSAEQM